MVLRSLRCLFLLALPVVALASCQEQGDVPSEPAGHTLEGAANCPAQMRNSCSIVADPNACEALCRDVVNNRIGAEDGHDGLHIMAFTAWETSGFDTEMASDLDTFNDRVLALGPISTLPSGRKVDWTQTNLDAGAVVIGAGETGDVFCYPNKHWCWEVRASAPFVFKAEAKQAQASEGPCAFPYPNDCEEDPQHQNVNPLAAVVETPVDNPATKLIVWSCSDSGFDRMVRFDALGNSEQGDLTGEAPPDTSRFNCDFDFGASAVMRFLDGIFGAKTVWAGRLGSSFAQPSVIGEETGERSARVLTALVEARYASVAEGTVIRIWENVDKLDLVAECVTERLGNNKKKGACTLLEPGTSNVAQIPTTDGDGNPRNGTITGVPCYWGTAEKVVNPSTAHFDEHAVCLAKDNPPPGESKEIPFDLR